MAKRYIICKHRKHLLDLFYTPLTEFGLSQRVLKLLHDYTCIDYERCLLVNSPILNLKDLITKSKRDLIVQRNFGIKSLEELESLLNSLGLCFEFDMERFMKYDDWAYGL